MHQKFIEEKINKCIEKLYKIDKYLLDCKVCERCLMFRLAHYLQNEFQDYFVDCEFNKRGGKEHGAGYKVMKYDDGEGLKKIYVDIIVHKRKPDEDGGNFICIEIKRTKRDIARDEERLRKLTQQKRHAFEYNGEYYIFGYKYGFLLYLPKNREGVAIDTFVDGEKNLFL